MAALSALRSRFFVPLCYTKRAPLRSGCRFNIKTTINIKTQFCHSVGNLTKWFDEVNLSKFCRDSYGMTKATLKNK